MRDALINARGRQTQTEVANAVGISQKQLSKLERGQCGPSFKTAVAISRFYNIDIKILFPDVFANEEHTIDMKSNG